jgi:hypothetical protein
MEMKPTDVCTARLVLLFYHPVDINSSFAASCLIRKDNTWYTGYDSLREVRAITGCSTHPLASQFSVEIRLKFFESKSVYSTYSPSLSMHAQNLCNHS